MLIDWKSLDLANASNVPHDTIRAFESGRTRNLNETNSAAVFDAFEKAGVEFIQENGGGAGVRLKSPVKETQPDKTA